MGFGVSKYFRNGFIWQFSSLVVFLVDFLISDGCMYLRDGAIYSVVFDLAILFVFERRNEI